eukprot:TRINITY_DN3738_c0_g1_i2.p1 TRINITY_DN3738_c0_g1~~TRINITY_DN3738_c0_g1_i2.p1  ORF type:complete len:276 (-),score=34.36 TRINITY_DN3738_c0_g1_i2:22-849(-)
MAQKFHIPESEVLLKLTDCTLKGVIKKVGKLYIFSNYLCFDSHVFGSTTKIALELFAICDLVSKKDTMEVKTLKQKYVFSQMPEAKYIFDLLYARWTDVRNASEHNDFSSSKLELKRFVNSVGSTSSNSDSQMIEMEPDDWATVLKDAQFNKYEDGERILKEGANSTSIFYIASGRVSIQKKSPSGIQIHGTLETGSLFGEMSFLVAGCATASIIADGMNVQIYVIEQTSLYLQFIRFPHLAGRFYSYLANILASRLSERELEINKEREAKKTIA